MDEVSALVTKEETAIKEETVIREEAPKRIMALDALRGFNMLWIIGADAFFISMQKLWDTPETRFIAGQLDHKDWAGFAFYDLIFPLFVFVVGASIALALSKTIEREGRNAAVRKVIWRGLMLYFMGFVYYGGFSHLWPDIRLLGVLPRIAICYFTAGLLFCFFRPRVLAGIAFGILILYWGAMTFIPFPDVRPEGTTEICRETGFDDISKLNFESTKTLRGEFIKGVNLANYVDQRFLPGFKWDGSWDPEGLLSTPAAIATCLFGVLAGLLLKNAARTDIQKVLILLLAGTAAVAAGWYWDPYFPVIKKIWTSSYVLVAAGYSAWLLAVFYLVIEVFKLRGWTAMFVWVGMNPITVYMADTLLDFHKISERIAGGDFKNMLDGIYSGTGDFLINTMALGMAILFCRFLYKHKIFLKI